MASNAAETAWKVFEENGLNLPNSTAKVRGMASVLARKCFMAGYKAAEANVEWIPVTVLPENPSLEDMFHALHCRDDRCVLGCSCKCHES